MSTVAKNWFDRAQGDNRKLSSILENFWQMFDLIEFQYMMEKLGAPQNHFSLKAMIKEVDEDQDEALVFREFLLIFR